MSKLLSFFRRASFSFVLINVFTAGLGFVRSFAFMKFLGFEELGLITMVNTTASLLSLFQIGLINGGYRIIALGHEKVIEKTNNNILSFLIVVSGGVFIITAILILLGIIKDYATALISISIGVLFLFNNWFTNRLIGSGKLQKLNYANSVSVIISLLCLILVYYYGFVGALICLFAQPMFFMLLSIDKTFKFTKFEIEISHLRYILSFGFIPFLSGIFFLIYSQIERWGISFLLGNEELGKMYLFFIILTLWILIPNSIGNIFFPKAIKYYDIGDKPNFNKTIYNNIKIIVTYNIIGSLLLFTLLTPLVGLFFPNHLPYVYLVFLSIIGLFFRTLADPFSLFFNSIVKLKYIFWSELISLFLYCISLLLFYVGNYICLETFIICFNIYFFSRCLVSLFFYFKIRKIYIY
jgi:membrane protein